MNKYCFITSHNIENGLKSKDISLESVISLSCNNAISQEHLHRYLLFFCYETPGVILEQNTQCTSIISLRSYVVKCLNNSFKCKGMIIKISGTQHFRCGL